MQNKGETLTDIAASSNGFSLLCGLCFVCIATALIIRLCLAICRKPGKTLDEPPREERQAGVRGQSKKAEHKRIGSIVI